VQLILAAALVSAAVIVAAWLASRSGSGAATRRDAPESIRRLQILALFAPGLAAAAEDPRALLVWQPLASTARALFPDDFAAIERAAGAPFPFGRDQIEAAHARWSSDWLAWERTHDGNTRLKGAAAEEELRASPGSAVCARGSTASSVRSWSATSAPRGVHAREQGVEQPRLLVVRTFRSARPRSSFGG
jgi:hypothetical protein